MSATLLEPPTKPGFLTEARHVVLPTGIVSSALPAVRKTCQQIGLDFDPWQVGTAKCILGKDDSGLYAADTIVLSIPRQVGKTFLIGLLVFADSIINPGTTTVWTAHRFKVARETFNELKGVALSQQLAPHIDPDQIYTAAGNESITFRNESRIVFAARERGAIRGFTKVRRLVLDEAQILSEAAMSDLAPTQNQAENPQIILMGTPPKPTDPGETFANLRAEALAGQTEGLVYVEFSAPPDCDIDDVEAWEEANPSLHIRTPVKAIRRLRKLLSSDDDFAREALGIWPDTDSNAPQWLVIPEAEWVACKSGEKVESDGWLEGPVTLAVEVTFDRSAATISAAGDCREGGVGVEVIESGAGTHWVVDSLVALTSDELKPVGRVVVDPGGPAASLIEPLEAAGVTVTQCKFADCKVATAGMRDAAKAKGIVHRDRPELNDAVAHAQPRTVSDAVLVDRRAGVDVSPFIAALLARWGHLQGYEPDESIYESRGLVELG